MAKTRAEIALEDGDWDEAALLQRAVDSGPCPFCGVPAGQWCFRMTLGIWTVHAQRIMEVRQR